MEYRYKYTYINIRYIFIFYFPKIFCPDFSVKIFIHKSNVLSDLYRTLIISIRLSFYVKIKGMHFGSQILILNSGRFFAALNNSCKSAGTLVLLRIIFYLQDKSSVFFHKANVL